MRVEFRAIAIGAIVILVLTGCSPESSTGDVQTPSSNVGIDPSPAAADGRWAASVPEDTHGSVYIERLVVDPDGSTAYGDGRAAENALDPLSPATIAKNGNIHLELVLRSDGVPRQIVEAFISADSDGTAKGPPLDCVYVDPVPPQIFSCSAAFQDDDYETGKYFAVVRTMPQDGQSQQGQIEVIEPFYTKRPGIKE